MIQLPELKKDTISMLNKYDSLNIFVKNFLLNKITESVEVPQSQIEGEINTLLVQYKIKDESELIKWLAKSNKTKDDLISQIVKPLKTKNYALSQFSNKIENRFLKTKDDLDQVVYLLIRSKNKNKARALYLQIKDDKNDFGELAKKYSEGPENLTRGIVGPVSLTKANPVLIKLLKSSKPDEINSPIFAGGWYLVTQLETIIKAKLDDNMRDMIAIELFNEWLNEEVANKINLSYKTEP